MSDLIRNRGCVICGQKFVMGEQIVPTTSGEYVHVICADHQARDAYRRRNVHAIMSAGFAVGLILFAKLIAMPDRWLAFLALFFLFGHALANRHWWCRMLRSARPFNWWRQPGGR